MRKEIGRRDFGIESDKYLPMTNFFFFGFV